MDALVYFNNLKSQGYDDDAALSYTNQHYPDFKLNSATNITYNITQNIHDSVVTESSIAPSPVMTTGIGTQAPPVPATGNYDDWFYQNFQQIAAECYPDDEGAIFTIYSITNNGEFIEVIAHSSPSIGYDPVRYDFSVFNGTPSLRHTFTSGPNGTWSPFFSTGNSEPQPAPVAITPTVQSNSVHQAPQQVQTPQPQQMMGQYAPQQPMMQGQPMQAYGQQGMMMQQVGVGSRSKIVTFLLGFFLGVFGVHNFYLGKTGLGITQFLLTILTFGIGTLITWPWSLIESILALASSNFRDGDGYALSG